jgi:DNA repair protein SbcC/Rad50
VLSEPTQSLRVEATPPPRLHRFGVRSSRPPTDEAVPPVTDNISQSAMAHATRDVRRSSLELKASLKRGGPCPVCEQSVAVLPKVPTAGAFEEARALVKSAEADLRRIEKSLTKAEGQLEALPARQAEINTRVAEAIAAINKVSWKAQAAVGRKSDADCLEALTRAVSEIRAADKKLLELEKSSKQASKEARDTADEARKLDRHATELSERVDGYQRELHRLSEHIESIRPEIRNAGGSNRIGSDLEALNGTKQKRDGLVSSLKNLNSDLERAQQSKARAEQQEAVLGERLRSVESEITRLNNSIGIHLRSWSALQEDIDLPAGIDEAARAESKRGLLEVDRDRITREIVRLEQAVQDTIEKIATLSELKKELDALRTERVIYEQLATALRADRFVAYLLEGAYADLCTKGSEHLMRISQERYSFSAERNEFYVKDGWNGDAERSSRTLSGGESFLASLALGLALADSVASFAADGRQGANIDALFLDEGVSNLDQDETLPAVLDALCELQSGDRMVCVISHMENLAERLPARIEIVKDHGRSSLKVFGVTASDAL